MHLLLERGTVGSLLFDTSRLLVSNGVTAKEVAAEPFTNPNSSSLSLLSQLYVFNQCTYTANLSWQATQVITKNGAKKCKTGR